MAEKEKVPQKKTSADWLLRGALTKIGDLFDRFTGRRWIPSSSLATSELGERIKKLLDSEAKTVPGKGIVVPHYIKLKMQWDKFSTDSETLLKKLENELLIVAIDHINDCLYYTYAPVSLNVKPDYFIEGVKLFVGFEKFDDEEREVEINVTVPAINVGGLIPPMEIEAENREVSFLTRFNLKDIAVERRIEFRPAGRISVGRTGENGLSINDASISKIHATLAINSDGILSVADTGSTNGTFINGERIAYGKASVLDADDIVKFGLIEVTFEAIPEVVDEVVEDDESSTQKPTVSIDGFEFTTRRSHESDPLEKPTSKTQSSE